MNDDVKVTKSIYRNHTLLALAFVERKLFLQSECQCHSVEISGFFVIQILCEINFGESRFRSSKIAVLAIFGALNFVNLVPFGLQKGQKYIKVIILGL